MAARPPQDSPDDSGTIEFGIAALAAHLDEADIDYPADQHELTRALDDPDIPIDGHGHSVSLSDILAEANVNQFDSQKDVLNTLHPVFEAHRDNVGAGVLASIRSLIPF